MKNLKNISRSLARKATYVLTFAMLAAGVWAQDTSTTTVRHHAASYNTEVRNARVVYVEGNDLVLRLEDGKVEHLVVPDSDKFTIDGKTVSVRELTPGTKLTQTITTTTTPRFVNTVRILKGKVWHVSAPHSVIVSLPDGTNHRYQVPSHAKFTVNGEKKTVFDLKKGMDFEATIITDEPQTIVAKNKTVVGQAPAPATPPVVGVLLIQPLRPAFVPAPAPAPVAASVPVTVASVEEPAETLPKTGSPLPLIGLLGALAVAMSLGMRTVRRIFTV
jgi:hypothetical protein